jgi:tocopherol cyclase
VGHRLLPFCPELYHGKKSSRPYFEGWYFKHAGEGKAFSVIPGIFRGREGADIAFVQVILTDPQRSFFIEYPPETFRCAGDRFELWVGENFFSLEKVILKIEEICLTAELYYAGITPVKKTCFSPSVMGPFSYLPGMQCNHGVLSLRHEVKGRIDYCGTKTEFNDAYGYIEKDWGEAFPESWIWMQGCGKDIAFMCSAASIPFGPFNFTGLICVLIIEKKEYRFATYNGSKLITAEQSGSGEIIEIKKGNILLKARAKNEEFISLKAPTKDGMDREISESICAHIELALIEKGKVFFTEFDNAGLEVSNTYRLMKK